MRTLDNNSTLLADLVDVCRDHGWSGVGQEHDIVRWLKNRLALLETDGVEVADDGHGDVSLFIRSAEALAETESERDYLNERVSRLRDAAKAAVVDMRSVANGFGDAKTVLRNRADLLDHIAED